MHCVIAGNVFVTSQWTLSQIETERAAAQKEVMPTLQEEQDKVAAVRQEAADELSTARAAAMVAEAERFRCALPSADSIILQSLITAVVFQKHVCSTCLSSCMSDGVR